jgi:hypothetical protein
MRNVAQSRMATFEGLANQRKIYFDSRSFLEGLPSSTRDPAPRCTKIGVLVAFARARFPATGALGAS